MAVSTVVVLIKGSKGSDLFQRKITLWYNNYLNVYLFFSFNLTGDEVLLLDQSPLEVPRVPVFHVINLSGCCVVLRYIYFLCSPCLTHFKENFPLLPSDSQRLSSTSISHSSSHFSFPPFSLFHWCTFGDTPIWLFFD